MVPMGILKYTAFFCKSYPSYKYVTPKIINALCDVECMRFKCGKVDYEEEYTGESGGTFSERFKEHMKAASHIHDHYNTTDHTI